MKQFKRLWQVLTGPWMSLTSRAEQHLARQLTVLLLFDLATLAFLVFLEALLGGSSPVYLGNSFLPVAVVTLLICYVLSRTRYYRWASLLLTLVCLVLVFAYAIAERNPRILLYSVLIIGQAVLFLPVPMLIGLIVANVTGILLSSAMWFPMTWSQTFIHIMAGAILAPGLVYIVVSFRRRQRQEQAAQLAKTEARYRVLLETTFEGLLIIHNGVILETNPGFLHMLGYDRQEVEGQPMSRFVVGDLPSRSSGKPSGEVVATEVHGIRKDGTVMFLEAVVREHPRITSAMSGSVNGGVPTLVALRDISERKQAELLLLQAHAALEYRVTQRTAELSQVNTRLQAEIDERLRIERDLQAQQVVLRQHITEMETLYRIGVAMSSQLDLKILLQFIVEQATPLVDATSCAILIPDETTGELVFRAATDPIVGMRVPAGQGVVGRVLRCGAPEIVSSLPEDPDHYQGVREQSGLMVASMLVVPLRIGEQVIGVLTAVNKLHGWFTEQDQALLVALGSQAVIAITNAGLYAQAQHELLERQRAEAALLEERAMLAQRVEERTAELRAANVELARAVRAKDEFLATMSHELRTPLTAILALSEMLGEGIYGPVGPRQQKAVQGIEESGRHLLAIINDILDIARIEAGKLVLDIAPVAVEEVCMASLRLVTNPVQAKKLQVSTSFDPQAQFVLADERYLKQILVNLLNNAAKFTLDGGVIGLDVRALPNESVTCFTIWDTGIGIAQESMSLLFKPFVQLDTRLSRQYEGAGLGLALVYRLVELHGGSVSVTSEVGKGSRFMVCLRSSEAQSGIDVESDSKLPVKPASESENPASEDRLVLVAEDDEHAATILVDYFTSNHLRVTLARNGLETLALVGQLHPDIILMDIQMPELDGLETMRRIRAQSPLQAIPIIAMTALVMPGDRERCLSAGADDYVSKPVSPRKLLTLVLHYLSEGRGQGSAAE
ncbi:MAG: response regulator [Anaerolineae bacterium]|nr:response regulator [Anaerolineae bacterium]